MPERVDATGETVMGHIGKAAQLLTCELSLPGETSAEEWLDVIAAARQRLDHAEKILRGEGK